MSNLRILLLGAPEILDEETPVQIQRRMQRALLFYLAAQENPVGRAELLTVFWPDEDETAARRHLREALSKLRSDLPDPDAVLKDQDRVSLDRSRVFVDVWEFQSLIQQVGWTPWQLPAASPLPEAVYQLLLKAIRLWRAPHFLSGANLPNTEELDNWVTLTSQNLEHLRGRILERLADHAAATGDLEAALHWLRMALENDELNEELHYRVLSLLAELGNRTEAIKYYSYLKSLFQRELDDRPSASIQSLYEKIRQETPQPVPPERPGWPVSLSMQVPFVGRAPALNDLKLAFHRGGMAVVFGEAGAGKSRLIQELFISIEPAPRLLLAPSRPLENNLPFQPLIDLLRHSVPATDWADLPLTWAKQLSLLLPELLIIRPDVPPHQPGSPDQARAMLFEAIHQLLMLLSRNQPVLFFLDDAQWADEATLATLAYLVERSFFEEHGLLILAARPEEQNVYLQNLLLAWPGTTPFLHIDLEQLDEGEISQLTRYALGQTPSPEFVHRLARDTGGNPLFLLETLRALLELSLGPDLSTVTDTLPLASSIHALVRNRLRRLNPQVYQVLITAATIGNEFDPRLVEKASRLEAEAVVQALDELERVHLVKPNREHDPESQVYYFIHDKIREVLLLELSPARRRLLHLRVAQALESSLGTQAIEQSCVLAQHYEAGGEALAAFHYWIQAGQRARQLFSLPEVYSSYRKAERLLQQLGSNITHQQIYQLYTSWGEVAFEVHDKETLSRVYSTLLHLGEQRQSHLLIGCALSGLGTVALAHQQPNEGLLYVDQAIPYLERAEKRVEWMKAYQRRGTILELLHRYPEAIQAYRTALDISDRVNDPGLLVPRINAHLQIARALALTGQPVACSQHAEQALQTSALAGSPYHQVKAFAVLALAAIATGKPRAAHETSHQGIDLAEPLRDWAATGLLHSYAACSALILGELDDAWDHANQAIRLGERAEDRAVLLKAYGVKGDLYRHLGAFPEAIEVYGQGLPEGDDSLDGLSNQYRLGLALSAAGEPNRGRKLVEAAANRLREMGVKLSSLPATLAQLAFQNTPGERPAALEQARQVEAEGRQHALWPIAIRASGLRGMLELEEGQVEEGLAEARAAIEQARTLEQAWTELRGLVWVGAACRRAGLPATAERERAGELLAHFASHSQSEAIRPWFEEYQKSVLSSF